MYRVINMGVHPLEAMKDLPLFQIPLFPKNVQTQWKSFQNFTFSNKNFSIFIRQKILSFFKSVPQNFEFPSAFAVLINFHLFRENYYFPSSFSNFPPDFVLF